MDKTQVTDEMIKQAEETNKKRLARANVAVEKFVAKIPKTDDPAFDKILRDLARMSYLAGRNDLSMEIIRSL